MGTKTRKDIICKEIYRKRLDNILNKMNDITNNLSDNILNDYVKLEREFNSCFFVITHFTRDELLTYLNKKSDITYKFWENRLK